MEKNKATQKKQRRYEDFILQVKKQMASFEHLLDKFKFDALNEQLGNETIKPEKLNDCFIKLSKRQTEIIYYLSLNKSPKEIAAIISTKGNKSILPATIQSVINKQLYVKFNVGSVGHLLQKASQLKLIPFMLEDDTDNYWE